MENVYYTPKSKKRVLLPTKKIKSNSKIKTSEFARKYQKSDDIKNFISNINKLEYYSNSNYKGMISFLFTKFKAMEEIDLNDELIDDDKYGKVEIRKIDIDKSVFPKRKPQNISCKVLLKKKEFQKDNKYKSDKYKLGKYSDEKNELQNNKNEKREEYLYSGDKKIKKIKDISIKNYGDTHGDFFSNKNALFSLLNELNKNQNK